MPSLRIPATLLVLVSTVSGQSIILNGVDVKAAPAPSMAEAFRAVAAPEAQALVVVQFSGPIQPQWVQDLADRGVKVRHYLAEFAYLVSVPGTAAIKAGDVSGATWIGILPPASKISAALASKLAGAADSKSEASNIDAIVLSFDELAAKALESSGFRIKDNRLTPMCWYETHVAIPLGNVLDVAEFNSVFAIEEVAPAIRGGERAAQAAAGQYEPGATAPFGPGYTAWIAAEGLSGGDNIVVHVIDDGLDQGIATNLPGTAHADLLGRIVGIYNATSDPDGASRAGHGQLAAAIIMGNATVGTVDRGGYLLGQGVAPMAQVYATKIFSDDGETVDIGSHTFTELTKLGQDAGATLSNNSWGAAVNGAYNARAAEFDALVRDADPDEPGNQQVTHFFCSGNNGPMTGTNWSPATAKNVISVGSHENSDADGYDGSGYGPTHADNIRDLVPGSSRGPTADGRLGVTVVATGTHVQGAVPTVDGYTGAHVSDKYWPPNQTDYARSSGTSFSTPVACGAGILIREMFRDQLSAFGHTSAPSPALIRAVLTNTAADLFGGSDGNGGTLGHIPNIHQGWGAVNLEMLAGLKTALFSIDQTHVFTRVPAKPSRLRFRRW